MNKPVLHLVEQPRTAMFERGPYRVIVSDHPDTVYLAVGNGCGAKGMFCSPRTALEIAAALTEAAAKAIEAQFAKQMGEP